MNALMIAIKVRTVMWRCWWMLPKEYPKRGNELAALRRDITLLGVMYRAHKIWRVYDE